MNADELSEVLALHKKWLMGGEGGKRADLSNAVLRNAILSNADLSYADLSYADLSNADLRNADLTNAILTDGVLWETFLSELVPALLTAGGKTLAEVATPEVWACHAWSSGGIACPIATAFDCSSLSGVPPLYRWQAERFIQFFDVGLVPLPTVTHGDIDDG